VYLTNTFYCHFPSNPVKIIKADLIVLPATKDGSMPTLLRLRETLPQRALTLESTNAQVGDQAFLLHHPQGRTESRLSIGDIILVEDPVLRYNINTDNGSSGGPILNGKWALIGMHIKADTEWAKDRNIGTKPSFNEGLSLTAILAGLRETAEWDEIAHYHNLANVTTARQKLENRSARAPAARPDAALLTAAVRWNFDPKSFSPHDVEQLRLLVSDPEAPRWALQASERQRLLRSAGSLDALRKARGKEAIDEPGQQVIDRILQGPPYNLEEIDEAALPHWLQAVRWFADIVPSLPKPAEVNRALQRRRVRSRLRVSTGSDFRGREEELAELRAWYQEPEPGPMVITGIGGVGKSALIAQFALGLPADTLLLWLDFDRADLAPDDAVSVLGLLSEQVLVQLQQFTAPTVDASSWQAGAQAFGATLAPMLKKAAAPLLVLDGFEVAQYVQQHQEIWQILELILAQAPTLRVVVSGRAPVKDLKLYGRTARTRHLKGMARADAEAWLRERGITDKDVLTTVLDISEGVPLVLKLALRLVEAGGEIQELPQELPKALIEGFLYQRILDRVIDPALKPVARDALVLRILSVEMIPAVLSDSIPAGLDTQEVFARLAREMGLVGDGADQGGSQAIPIMLAAEAGVLRMRPEVRSATLRLLEIDDAARVRLIDKRAAAWYAGQDLDQVTNAAELVYHRLRLGDLAGAEQAWRDDCAPLLLFAADDLPETAQAARQWIGARTGNAALPSISLEVWEHRAVERIRDVIGRGLLRAIPDILNERGERSTLSPLLLYDVWMRWYAGDLVGARATLSAAGAAEGSIGRDRALLGALLAAHASDRPEADRLLAQIEDERRWRDRKNKALETIAVRAARVRLTVDLQTELDLVQILNENPDPASLQETLSRFLRPGDVALPALSQRLGYRRTLEVLGEGIGIPTNRSELQAFAQELDRERRATVGDAFFAALPLDTDTPTETPGPWRASDLNLPRDLGMRLEGRLAQGAAFGLDLAVLGWRRWGIATTSLFLAQACEQALRTDAAGDLLRLSVAGTLAAFRGQELGLSLGSEYFRSLDDVLGKVLLTNQAMHAPPPPADRLALATKILSHEPEASRTSVALMAWLAGTTERNENPTSGLVSDYLPGSFFRDGERQELRTLLLYLLGPDPLEMLFRRIVGLPDIFTL